VYGPGSLPARGRRPSFGGGRPYDGPVIEEAVVARVLTAALRSGGDFAEVFAEDRRSSSARLDDGRVEELTSGRDRGAGIRVVRGETTGFAHTSDLSEAGLLAAAEAAGAAARGGGQGVREVALSAPRPQRPSRAQVLPEDVPKERKVDLLKRAEDAARAEDGAVRQVAVTYGDGRRRFLVANSDGLVAGEDQVRTRLSVSVVAGGDGTLQTGYETAGGTVGFEIYDRVDVEGVARVAARRAADLLKARPAPSGQVPVVLRKGAGGILFHEACGHGLESDLVGKDASVFRGKVGEQVASPLVTLVDDGSYVDEWGSYGIDDEGHPAQRNVLIEDGRLTDYMWDFLRARKEGRGSSGNGRRQGYQHLPMVRMTNTYVLAGTEDPDEIIRQTPYGVYCVQLGGGQVNTATGDFVFGMTEAYLIENGVVTAPLRSANLIGNGPEVLRSIDAMGNDFETWAGTCGKDGQGVPVSSGQATLRVSSMTVGGTGG
jgi:TldD protein